MSFLSFVVSLGSSPSLIKVQGHWVYTGQCKLSSELFGELVEIYLKNMYICMIYYIP